MRIQQPPQRLTTVSVTEITTVHLVPGGARTTETIETLGALIAMKRIEVAVQADLQAAIGTDSAGDR